MDYTYGIGDDYLDDDDDGVMYSTRTYSSDSDDEKPFGFGPAKQHKSKKAKCSHPDAADDFEREMTAELEATVKKIRDSFTKPTKSNSGNEVANEAEYYDQIYFDSDESDSEEVHSPSVKGGVSPTQRRRKKAHKVLTNDELLYDPALDDVDQAWVDSQRRAYQLKKKGAKSTKGVYIPEPLPKSDAVLSCPACFTTLCLDCQRHEIYKNQYRAMFVFNCNTDHTEVLSFAIKETKTKKKFKSKKKQQPDADLLQLAPSDAATTSETTQASGEAEDKFHPVLCSECHTKVGVQDLSEVYHFFNVLTSY